MLLSLFFELRRFSHRRPQARRRLTRVVVEPLEQRRLLSASAMAGTDPTVAIDSDQPPIMPRDPLASDHGDAARTADALFPGVDIPTPAQEDEEAEIDLERYEDRIAAVCDMLEDGSLKYVDRPTLEDVPDGPLPPGPKSIDPLADSNSNWMPLPSGILAIDSDQPVLSPRAPGKGGSLVAVDTNDPPFEPVDPLAATDVGNP